MGETIHMDFGVPPDMDEADAMDAMREVVEEWDGECQCGCSEISELAKAVDINHSHDPDDPLLTPAVQEAADLYRGQVEGFLDRLMNISDALLTGDEKQWDTLRGASPGFVAKALRMRPHERDLIPLTAERMKELWNLVDDYAAVFMHTRLGVEESKERIKRWKKMGLIEKNADLTDYLKDAYRFTRFADALDNGTDFTSMKRLIAANPLTPVQEAAFEPFRANGCAHIKGLANTFMQKLTTVAQAQPDYSLRLAFYSDMLDKAKEGEEEKVKAKIKEVVIEAKKARMGRGELASELRQQSRDWGRDWWRIAHTEYTDLENHGRAENMRTQYGDPDPWVIVIVRDTACAGCKKLFLLPDGSPRPFKLSWLENNGRNADKKWLNPKTGRYVCLQPQRIKQDENTGMFTAEFGGWLPTIPSVHPFCCCLLTYYPKVMEWVSEENFGVVHWPHTIRTSAQARGHFETAMERLRDKLVAQGDI